MKKSLLFLLILTLSLSLAGTLAYADRGECPHGGGYMAGAGEEAYACPIVGKFMKKAHFYLENEGALGLSEDQVKSIKELKMAQKKAYIRQAADLQIFELEMKEKLSETKIDVEGLNAMLDKTSAGMTASAKETVSAYAKLKSVLSKEQQEKAKEIWKQKKD